MEGPKGSKCSATALVNTAVRCRSLPSSLCAPIASFSKLTTSHEHLRSIFAQKSAFTQSLSPIHSFWYVRRQETICPSLGMKTMTEIWKRVSRKLWTVAACSTAQSYSESSKGLHNTESNLPESPELLNDVGRDNMPGMPSRHQSGSRSKKKAAVNEMQVNYLIEQETGMQRLRVMYDLGPDWMFVQEDTRSITTIFYRSVILGFFLNALKAAQSEAKKPKHSTPSQAVMKMGMTHMSDSTRVLKEATKNSLRLTAFAASLLYLSQSIAAYRNESSVWEYAISGSVAMAAAGLGKPPVTFATGIIGGAVVGCLGGSLICSMLSSAGATQEQRTLNRIRLQLEQKQQQQAFEQEDGSIS